MNLYLDASALVKRYVVEPGSDRVRSEMAGAGGWFICRTGFVEIARAVELVAGSRAAATFIDEWPAFAVVEIDQALVERAAVLAAQRQLRTLDSLHLAAALVLPSEELGFATWDRRLHAAAAAEGLAVVPASLH